MKTRILTLGMLLTCLLFPARADEEKPQAVYDIEFIQDEYRVKPVLKMIEGGSPLAFDYPRSTTQGKVDIDNENRSYVTWYWGGGVAEKYQFCMVFNERSRTTRYILKGELGTTSSGDKPLLQVNTTSPASQGDTAFFWLRKNGPSMMEVSLGSRLNWFVP